MIDLNRPQPITKQKKEVRRKVDKSLRRNVPLREKKVLKDTDLKTKWDEDRKPINNLLKIGLIAYLVLEVC